MVVSTEVFSADGERAVLSHLLLNPSESSRAATALSYRDFYDRQMAALFRAMTEGATGAMALADKAARYVPGDYTDLLADLLRISGVRFSLDDAIGVVKDRSSRRQLAAIDLSIALDTERPLAEVVESLAALLKGFHPEAKNKGFLGADSLMPELLENLEARSSGVSTPKTGMLDLDQLLYGLTGGRFWTIAARSGIGKTMFTGQLLLSAIAQGHRCGFIGLEMSSIEILQRMVASRSQLEATKLFGAPLTAPDLEKITKQILWEQWPLLHLCDETRGQSEILFEIKRLKEDFPDLKMVAVDYLQIVKKDNPRQEVRHFLAEFTADLKQLSRDLQIDILGLSQVNRDCTNRQNKRPQESDISEGDAILHNSDLVLLLHREDYYDKETPKRGVFEVNVAKHRNGPTGQVDMLYDAETQTLRNMAKPNRY